MDKLSTEYIEKLLKRIFDLGVQYQTLEDQGYDKLADSKYKEYQELKKKILDQLA